MTGCVWRAGDPRYAKPLEPIVRSLLGKGDTVEILREKPGRRRLARAELPSGESCFLKHLLAGEGWRDRWKRRLGLSPGAREFRNLGRLRAAGVPVVEALALFECDTGDAVVVTRFLEGESLGTALSRPPPERRALLRAAGGAVAKLHGERIAHRDLHRENVWVTEDGPLLIDLQQAAPLFSDALRLRDLGDLDASVAPLLSLADRMRLRAATLGVERPFDAPARARLRQVGLASLRRHRAHVESRTRRSLREGRLYARFECALGRGMRLRSQPEAALERAFAESGAGVSHFRSASLRAGSPARSAWLAGHGLRARGIGAALPLAFVERRGLRGVHSGLLLEPAAQTDTSPGAEEVVALGVALRRHAVVIPADARPCRAAGGALALTGLEAIRFPSRLRQAEVQRIDALVEKAMPESLSNAERREALDRYARRVAFYVPEMVIQRK